MKIKYPFFLGLSVVFFITQAVAMFHVGLLHTVGEYDLGSEVTVILSALAGTYSMYLAIEAE